MLNEKNLEKIRLSLENSIDCFKIIDSINDPDIMFDPFRSILVNLTDSIAPLKKFRLKRIANLPWIDDET